MSKPLPAAVLGAVLVGAAVIGMGAVAFFPRAVARSAATVPRERADTQWSGAPPAGAVATTARVAPDTAIPLGPLDRDEVGSPFSALATDTVAARCAALVREKVSAAGVDTAGVEIVTRVGVRPPPGRGPDSLVVEGTAPGRDSTRAVWHCAATARSYEEVATLTAVVEDGWPGVPSRFDIAHVLTMRAEDACLRQARTIYREFDFRGVKAWRVADTLHLTGEAIPLNTEDLAGDLHCRALVREGRVIQAQAKAAR